MADKLSVVTYAAARKMMKDSLVGKGAIQGQKGDKGDKGDTGAQGERGLQGEKGKDANVQVGNVTSADTPSVTSRQVGDIQYLDFALVKGEKGDPGTKGEKGDPGAQGVQGIQGIKGDTGAPGATGADGAPGKDGADGKSFTIRADYATEAELLAAHPTGSAGDAYFVGASSNPDLYVWLADENRYGNEGKIQGVKGEKGDKGDKGDPGEKGEKGDPGAQGIQGIQGAKGDPGKDGAKGDDGFTPTVEATKNANHVALKITNRDGNTTVEIPHGDKGEKGDKGEQGLPGVTLPDNVYKLNEEVRIGTWIDGKPIYRQVIVFVATSGYQNIATIKDIELLIRAYGGGKSSTSSYSVDILTGGSHGNEMEMSANVSTGVIRFYSQGWASFTMSLILEYTKTTDTATPTPTTSYDTVASDADVQEVLSA